MNKLPERVRIKDIARLADVSVGTVDRVLHGRNGVSEVSKKRVEEILKELDYHPNMYASALASNKKYTFCCLLPKHNKGEYWTDIEKGIKKGVNTYSDFHLSVITAYYDPYDYESFIKESESIVDCNPDGVIVAPTTETYTTTFIGKLNEKNIPYIFIDSNIKNLPALAFYGQNSRQSGYFAARMLMLLANGKEEVVIFKKIHQGIVGSNQQESREKGFRSYMRQHHPSCIIKELNLDAENENDDYEMIHSFFVENPTLNTGITFNSKAYIIGDYLAKNNKEFNLIGYDLLESNIACLRKGTIAFLIAQQPELQGFEGVKTLCDYLIFKKEVKSINYMPIDLLSIDNIDYYSNANENE